MKISIIIPVGGIDDRNRLVNFRDTIHFLKAQSYKDMEIVVIEQELSEDRATYYGDSGADKYLSIRSQIYSDKFNYAWCSNVGARKSTGELLMFFASDLLLDKDYISEVVKCYETNKHPFFMPWSRIYRLNGEGYDYWVANKRIDETLSKKEYTYTTENYDFLYPNKEAAAGGPVMTRKFFFEKFFGYNESFAGWGCEDNEALWRLEHINNGITPIMNRHMYHLPHSKKSLDATTNRQKYILYIHKIEETIKNIEERKDMMGDVMGPTYIPIPSLPTIFYFNWNVGSGIERTGNTILNCIKDRHPIVYKAQNPPCIIAKELAKQKPDIILINENYPRIFESVYHYKMYYPKTKIIFFNHCYDFLVGMPFKDDYDITRLHRDGTVLINYLFLNNRMINHVINLNYKPPNIKYPHNLGEIVIERYHPIEDKFKLTVPFKERPKDFFYYGNILPHKFSLAFAKTIKNTNIKIDIYSDPKKTDDEKYISELMKIDNLVWKGRIPENELIDTLNRYRFFICPHEGDEPFNLAIAESIRCGCIPLITNDRTKPGADWIDWAKGCYIEYNNPKEMAVEMTNYISKKNDMNLLNQLNEASDDASVKMIYETSEPRFKELLSQLLDN